MGLAIFIGGHMAWTPAVGDKVAYSSNWLRSVGAYTGDLGHARGVITELDGTMSFVLARIKWNLPDIPERVNVKNLIKLRPDGSILVTQ
jgi:hypothetical protein